MVCHRENVWAWHAYIHGPKIALLVDCGVRIVSSLLGTVVLSSVKDGRQSVAGTHGKSLGLGGNESYQRKHGINQWHSCVIVVWVNYCLHWDYVDPTVLNNYATRRRLSGSVFVLVVFQVLCHTLAGPLVWRPRQVEINESAVSSSRVLYCSGGETGVVKFFISSRQGPTTSWF